MQIVDILFQEVLGRLDERALSLELTEGAKRFLATKGFDEKFGARPLKRAMQRYLEDPFSEAMLQGRFAPRDDVVVEVADDGESLRFTVRGGAPREEESVTEEVG